MRLLKSFFFCVLLLCGAMPVVGQTSIPLYGYATSSGVDTYTATISPTPSLQPGLTIKVKFASANTGAATLNLNSLGAKSIVKSGGTGLSSGDITAGQVFWLIYDGTNWQVVGDGGSGGGGGNGHVILNNGTPLTQRSNLNILNGLTASDNNPNTDVKWGGALTGNTTITMGSNTVSFSGNTVTFGPTASVSGLNVGSIASNPSSLNNGDVWYNSAAPLFYGRVNGNSLLFMQFNGSVPTTGRIPVAAVGSTYGWNDYAGLTYAGATGQFALTQPALSASWVPQLLVTPGAHTAFTAATEFISNDFKGATQTWNDGTTNTQRFTYFRGFTVNKTTTAATFTDIYNVYIDPSTAGTGVTFTRNWALGLGGGVVIKTSTGSYVIDNGSVLLGMKTGGAGLQVGSVLTNGSGFGVDFMDNGNNVTMARFIGASAGQGYSSFAFNSTTTTNATMYLLQSALGASWKPTFRVDPGAHTSITNTLENINNDFAAVTQTWAGGGTVATQRGTYFRSQTLAGASAQTFTNAYTVYIDGPTQGTNATITNPYALGLNGGLSVIRDNLNTTQANYNGLYLVNNTAAANNAQQISPSVVFEGQGWKTTATAASQSSQVKLYVIPIQGTTNPTGALAIEHWANGSFVAANYFHRGGLNFTNNSDATTSGIGFGNGSTPNARGSAQIYQSGSSLVINNATGFLDFSNVSLIGTSGSQQSFRTTLGFAPTSGTATWSQFLMRGTVNQTGGANGAVTILDIDPTYTAAGGAVTGINYDPTVTSIAGTHLAIRTTSGQNLLGNSSSDVVTASTRLDVRAGGTTSSDNGLRVANSANLLPMVYRGDGILNLNNLLIFDGVNRIISNNGGTLMLGLDVNTQLAARANHSTGTPSGGVFRFYNVNTSYTATSGNQLIMGIEVPFAPTSGTAALTGLGMSGTVNQTGGANGDVTMMSMTPTYTAVGGGAYGRTYNPTVTSITGVHYADNISSGGKVWNGRTSPAQITANQNDYNPTGIHQNYHIRISSDAARDITGIVKGADGEMLVLHNVGAFSITLKDESVSSAAANRFALNADVVIAADQSVSIWYDATSTRWRVIN